MWESNAHRSANLPPAAPYLVVLSITVQVKFYSYKNETTFHQSTAVPTKMFYYLSFVAASAHVK